jgi:signal transduction histidine kinase
MLETKTPYPNLSGIDFPDSYYDQFLYENDSNQSELKTLGDLPSFSYTATFESTCKDVITTLEDDPRLPGVLLKKHGEYIGYLSRRKIFEWLGKPFATEVFLKRPVSALYEAIHYPQQPLSAELSIQDALVYAVSRDINHIYEPLIVQFSQNKFRLMDFQVLVIAQARELKAANALIQEQLEISSVLSSSLNIQHILTLLLEHIQRIAWFDRARVFLLEKETLHCVAEFPKPEINQIDFHILVSESNLFQQVFFSRMPLRNLDIQGETDFYFFDSAHQNTNWMLIPMTFEKRILGVIAMSRDTIPYYSVQDSMRLQTITQQAAIAIHNASLFEEVRAFNIDLEKKVKQKTVEIENAMARMQLIDHAKSNFIKITAEQLSKPVNAIQNLSLELNQRIVTDFEEQTEISENFNSIMSEVLTVQKVISLMDDLNKVETGNINLLLQSIDMGVLINRIMLTLKPLALEKDISIVSDSIWGLPRLIGDRELIMKAIEQLLVNSIRYSPEQGKIWINARVIQANQNHLGVDALQLSIVDEGIGVEMEYQEAVFEKFFRINHDNYPNQWGIGLGLSIAREIIRAHNGIIWLESPGYDPKKLPGTSANIMLPLTQLKKSKRKDNH